MHIQITQKIYAYVCTYIYIYIYIYICNYKYAYTALEAACETETQLRARATAVQKANIQAKEEISKLNALMSFQRNETQSTKVNICMYVCMHLCMYVCMYAEATEDISKLKIEMH
jgi:hypothetical protein